MKVDSQTKSVSKKTKASSLIELCEATSSTDEDNKGKTKVFSFPKNKKLFSISVVKTSKKKVLAVRKTMSRKKR